MRISKFLLSKLKDVTDRIDQVEKNILKKKEENKKISKEDN